MMGDIYKVSRRDFIISTAAALLLSRIPSAQEPEGGHYRDVNWELVLNRVIGDRNAVIMGCGSDINSYKVGSPEWCMEEVLAEHGLLAEGARVHV